MRSKLRNHLLATLIGLVVGGLLAGGAGIVVLVIRLHSESSRLHLVQTQLAQNINSQVPNRVENVAAWCGGINATRDYDRSLVAKFHVPYTLPDLNCAKLESRTAASAQH